LGGGWPRRKQFQEVAEFGFGERTFRGVARHATDNQIGEVESAGATDWLGMVEAEVALGYGASAVGTLAVVEGAANNAAKIGQVVIELGTGGMGSLAVVMHGVGGSLGEGKHRELRMTEMESEAKNRGRKTESQRAEVRGQESGVAGQKR